MAGGLDTMGFGGLFQPKPSCDSVLSVLCQAEQQGQLALRQHPAAPHPHLIASGTRREGEVPVLKSSG